MRIRSPRILAILCGILLAVQPLVVASAATYPYETQSADDVNLRKYASSSSVVLAYIDAGDTVTVLGESGSYYKVQFGDTTGYAMKKYINGDSLKEDPEYIVNNLSSVTDYPYQTVTTASVRMRSKANDTATVIITVPEGAIITVSSVTASRYAKVTYSSKTGYISTDYIRLASAVATPTPIPETTVQPDAEKYPTLQTGDSGTFVTALQEALTELRFYKDTVDGEYGSATEAAVLAFEKKNKLTQDGIADPDLLYLLFEGSPRNYGGYKKTVKTVPPIYGLTLQYGNKGEPVKQLQTRLQELGYYDGEISGTFNSTTRTALKAFQKKMGISQDGIATSDVQTILYSASAINSSYTVTPTPVVTATVAPPSDTVRYGDTGSDVKKVQTQLKNLGYYDGTVDGKYGNATKKAVIAFQESNNLTADGICGSSTIATLFGSDVISLTATATPAPTATVEITEDVATIQTGSMGIMVLSLQTRLQELGYYISRLDGVFMESDMNAVEAFQKENGLTADGKAGYETQKLLYSDSAKTASVDATAEEDVNTYTTLRYGDTGTEVTEMQERLISLGYLTGEADGNFGLKTKAAVVAFQKANSLVRDGVAGTKTLATLYGDDVTANTLSTTTTLKEGMVSSAVRKLQQRLIELGYLDDTADGNFGPTTSLALIEFQNDQNLTADGIAGKITLAALNSLLDDTTTTSDTDDEETVVAVAPNVDGTISASSVRYANWYDEIRDVARQYPNVTVYDYNTGISWHVTLFSFGAHADGYPTTAEDTEKLYEAFGGEVTWTPKPVWVVFSNGSVYMASTHDVAHSVNPCSDNNFDGHLCIHFPRTAEQVAAIGPYATSHQKAIDLGWTATVALAVKESQ